MIKFDFSKGIFLKQCMIFEENILKIVKKMVWQVEKEQNKFLLIQSIVNIKKYIIGFSLILIFMFIIFVKKGKSEFYFYFGNSMLFIMCGFLILFSFYMKNYFVTECSSLKKKLEIISNNFNKNYFAKFDMKTNFLFSFDRKFFFNYPIFKIEFFNINSNDTTRNLMEGE